MLVAWPGPANEATTTNSWKQAILNLIIPLRVYELNSITSGWYIDVTNLRCSWGKTLRTAVRQSTARQAAVVGYSLHRMRMPWLNTSKKLEHWPLSCFDQPREFTVYAPEHIVIHSPVIEGVKLIENPLSENMVLWPFKTRQDRIWLLSLCFKQEKEQAFVYEHIQMSVLFTFAGQDHPTPGILLP